MKLGSRRVYIQHAAPRIDDEHGIGGTFKKITEPLLSFMQGLFGVNALKSAAAVVRQGLERGEILVIISPQAVALH